MGHPHWGAVLLRAALAATGVACAAGGDPAPDGGSQLRPSFRPANDKAHRKQAREVARGERQQPTARGGRTRSAEPGDATAAPSPSAPSAPPSPVTARAVASDPAGDVAGLGGAPAYVDLSRVTLARDGQRYRLVVETAGTLPLRQEGDDTMNVEGFVDRDRDGAVDYEVWATLADDGWGSSSRDPDGARFGEASGVEVSVAGSTLTMVFAGSVVGGAESFQWSAASEYGTVEQVAAGTTAQDYAPDRGAAAFPG